MLQVRMFGYHIQVLQAKKNAQTRVTKHSPVISKLCPFSLTCTHHSKASPSAGFEAPGYTLLMKKSKVLYDNNEWYGGIIMGYGKLKMVHGRTKSDGESTHAFKDDPEVHVVPK